MHAGSLDAHRVTRPEAVELGSTHKSQLASRPVNSPQPCLVRGGGRKAQTASDLVECTILLVPPDQRQALSFGELCEDVLDGANLLAADRRGARCRFVIRQLRCDALPVLT